METKVSFYGAALRVARTFAGLTQADLGERVGVTRQYIHQLEASGHKERTGILAEAFADVLGVEVDFFSRRPQQEINEEVVHFRRRKTTPLHMRNRVLAQGTLFQEVVAYLESVLKLPVVNVPQLPVDGAESIELAAEQCRTAWGVPLDVPIGNVTRLLERAGIVVATFSEGAEKVDAFSWYGERPVIVRQVHEESASRTRFDLGHECGHLVLHTGQLTGDSETEDQANRFAGALLLPRRGFMSEFPRGRRMNWTKLLLLKQRWGVSLQAMVRRAYDLRVIDAAQYRSAFVHISRKGWRKREPGEKEEEKPELVDMAFSQLANVLGVAPSRVAQELGLGLVTLERVVASRLRDYELHSDVIPLGPRRSRTVE